jgi:hypothetical protein
VFVSSPTGNKKFEYFSPIKTPSEKGDLKKSSEMVKLFGLSKTDEGGNKSSPVSTFMDNQVYFATCTPKKNRKIKNRHYNVSPDGVSSLDDEFTITYETNTQTCGRRYSGQMYFTVSDGNSNNSELSSEQPIITESLETSSLKTQSTNCSRTTGSPLPSSTSGLSLATTATCKKETKN